MDNLAVFFAGLTVIFFIANAIFTLSAGFKRPVAMHILLSLVLTAVLVLLYSTKNLIVFFALWEVSTWLTYFMANNPDKSRKYLWVSLFGEFLMLIAVVRTIAFTGSMNIASVAQLGVVNVVMFCLPFVVKSGILPFNFWVGDMYTGADKRFVAYLSAIIGKLGVFGFLRFFIETGIVSVGLWQNVIIYLAAITAVWATFKAVASEDAIETLSFSSLSQVSFIVASVLLLNQYAMLGAVLHYLNHMLIKTGMFMSVVYIWNRIGSTKFVDMGDFVMRMPFTFLFFLMLGISLAGVPPMGGVVSKWLMYEGFVSQVRLLPVLLFFVAGVGSFLYVYRLLHSIFLGRKKKSMEQISEMNFIAILPVAVSAIAAFLIGAYSKPFVAQGSKALGLDIDSLKSAIGFADISIVSIVFGALVVFAIVLWWLLPRHRYVPDTEGYTAAAYLPEKIELWDYSYNFYAPVARLGEKFVKFFSLDWLGAFWMEYVSELGQVVRGIYNGALHVYLMYIAIVLFLSLNLWGIIKEILK